MTTADRLPTLLIALLPGAIVVWLSFSDGGFYPGGPALVAAVLVQILVLRTTLARRPFEGLGLGVALLAGGLGALAVWTVASALWSDAPARALVEADRALLYALLVVAVGSLPRESAVMRWVLYGIGVAVVVVCLVALATRLLPDTFPIGPNLSEDRLSYPLGYWNALGILAASGVILAVHLASSLAEPAPVRVAAAGAVPLLASTVLFTFSRGAILCGLIGLVAYGALARPRGIAAALLAVVPPTVVALAAVYGADAVTSADPRSAAAVDEGRDVLALLIGCTVAALVVRALALALDARLAHARLPPRARRPVQAAGAGLVLAGVAAAIAAGAPGAIERQYDQFVEGGGASEQQGAEALRARLLDPGNNGRIEQWDSALQAFSDAPLTGQGAGTYQQWWQRTRDEPFQVVDAHSLYLEVLGELGVVGLGLLVLVVLAMLGGLLSRVRGRHRALYAAGFAIALAWALHAGLDWDWEMPAVTCVPVAIGAAALAVRARRPTAGGPTGGTRVTVAVGWLVLAVTPVLIVVSQGRLGDAEAAYDRGDCVTAKDRALSAIAAVAARPEPYEILGYCALEQGFPTAAVDAMAEGVERDPDSWALHYGLAVARASAGLDPRPAARRALALNPQEAIVQFAEDAFAVETPRAWAREARRQLRVRLQGRDLFATR